MTSLTAAPSTHAATQPLKSSTRRQSAPITAWPAGAATTKSNWTCTASKPATPTPNAAAPPWATSSPSLKSTATVSSSSKTYPTNLSYDYKVVYFNSMFCPPIPQSRDRVYITFWRQGSRKPDLDFMPAGWCKHCQTEIAARQTWKANHSLRIRYGKQYIYTCPRCHREVFPYTTPAAAAIDWTLPITRIGDRSKPLQPKTIARIKIGLARYHEFMLDCIHTPRGSDTSMIFPIDKPHRTQLGQITHGLVVQTSHGAGNRSQPLTKPLPTQTSAQDLGIVIGLSHANGNHVHLTTEPTATQTTRQDKALIMPPFLAKLYGQSTTEPIDAPIGTQTGGGIHHGLVIPYYNTGVASPTDKPLPTATGIARHGLVQPGSTIDVDDCYFRMLVSAEVGAAMNFPANYVVLGNERQRVKQYGQAVTPDVPAMITRRLLESIQ